MSVIDPKGRLPRTLTTPRHERSAEPEPYLTASTRAEFAALLGADVGANSAPFAQRVLTALADRFFPPGGLTLATEEDAFSYFADLTLRAVPYLEELLKSAPDEDREVYAEEANDFLAGRSSQELTGECLSRLRAEAPESGSRTRLEQALLTVMPTHKTH